LLLRLIDYNLLYEKLVYFNCKINKLALIGKVISYFIHLLIRVIFNCDISPNAYIGKNVRIPHAVGIVIGGTAVIGDNSIIMPNVVIGSKHYPPKGKKRHATIGERCLLGANSTLIGDIIVGDECIVGAGCTLTKSLEPQTRFLG